MSGLLDTSVVIRCLTGEPTDMAAAAARIVEEAEELKLTDSVIAETAYVLTTVYQLPRAVVVDTLITLFQRENITTFRLETDTVLQSLLYCRPSRRVSFVDALTWAAAQESRHHVIYTFDRRLPSDGVELRDAAPK